MKKNYSSGERHDGPKDLSGLHRGTAGIDTPDVRYAAGALMISRRGNRFAASGGAEDKYGRTITH